MKKTEKEGIYTHKTKMKKKTKKEYIEMDVVDWDKVFLTLISYPFLVCIGVFTFFFNFIRYNLKLLAYLVVCLIPIVNSSIITTKEPSFFESYDEFEFKLFDNLKVTKKYYLE